MHRSTLIARIALLVFGVQLLLAVPLKARETSTKSRVLLLLDEVEEVLRLCPAPSSVTFGKLREDAVSRRFDIKAASECAYLVSTFYPGPQTIQDDIAMALHILERSTWLDPNSQDLSARKRIVREYREAHGCATRLLAAFRDLIERQDDEPAPAGSRRVLCDFDDEKHGLVLPDGEVCLAASLLAKSFFSRGSFAPHASRADGAALRQAIRIAGSGAAALIEGYSSLTSCSQAQGSLFFEECRRLNERANRALNGFLGLGYWLGNHREVARLQGWDDGDYNSRVYEDLIASLSRGEPQTLAFVAEVVIDNPAQQMAAALMGARLDKKQVIVRHAVVAHEIIEFDDIACITVWDPNQCLLDECRTEIRYQRRERRFYFVSDAHHRLRSGLPAPGRSFVAKVFLPEKKVWATTDHVAEEGMRARERHESAIGWGGLTER